MKKLSGKFDLHTHTVYSDGTFTVEEILNRAQKLGLNGISITDHDTMEGIKKAQKIAEELGIQFIPGIEFSCNYRGDEIHILGYFLDDTSEILTEKLQELKRVRILRNEKIIRKLNNLGLKINMQDVEKEVKGNIMSRAHISNVLLKKGYVYTKSEAFKQYLGKNRAAYVEKESSDALEIIKIIKKCGGISAMAHPKLICNSKERVEKMIDIFIKEGLDGIEVEHSSYDFHDIEYYRKLAEKKNLLMVGGSDFHGDNRQGVDIGQNSISEEDIVELLKKAEEVKI